MSAETIREAVINSKMRIKPGRIQVLSDCIICVQPAETTKSSMYYVLQQMKQDLPKVPIKVGPAWIARCTPTPSPTPPLFQ